MEVSCCNISGNIAKHDVCSVQGYGEKAPGIGAYVYPGSGATCDTKPVQTGLAATQAGANGESLRARDAVSQSCLSLLTLVRHKTARCQWQTQVAASRVMLSYGQHCRKQPQSCMLSDGSGCMSYVTQHVI